MSIVSAVLIVLIYDRDHFNRHAWDILPARLSEGLKLTTISSLTLSITITLIRLSLCCFYQRLQARSGTKHYRRSIIVVMVLMVIFQASFLITTLLQCM
jgi:hypothetical protein